MNPLRRLFSLLIISIGIPVCSTLAITGNETENVRPEEGLTRFSPLAPMEGPLLFKAAISIFGDYYSGLVLIKQMPADSAIHVVFLSELGLNLMDLSYRDDKFTVVSVQEFLNRRSILSTLQSDFRCLLLDLSLIEDYTLSSSKDGLGEMLKFRHKGQRYFYSCHSVSGPSSIRKKKGLFGRVDFSISKANADMQAEENMLKIGIRHRGVRLKIDLTELNQL